MLDFKQLRSFVAIVDYRNFSKAADKLNIAQSSVSTHLLQLEKELGTKLVNRTTKTIEITDDGWKVYRYASQILEFERCVFEECSPHAHRIIRIGASTIPATYILPEVLHQYGEFSSNDHFRISQRDSKDIFTGVLERRFDVGLTEYPVQKAGLNCVPLCRNQMIIIAPVTERYLQMQQRGVSMGELLKEPIILQEQGDLKSIRTFLNRMGIDEAGLLVAARVNDLETVKKMVAGGLGISLISEIAAQDFIHSRRLLKFDMSRYQGPNHVCLIYPDSCTSKDNAWNFIDYLRASKALPSGTI